MKKTRVPKDVDDELPTEIRFDYTQAKPNRFADRVAPGSRIVVLDPDVAEVFPTPESVNAVLRALIETMPTKPAPVAKRLTRPRREG
jgi:hypothetical protein